MLFDQGEEKGFKVIGLLHMISFLIQLVLLVIAFFFVSNKDTFKISNTESVIYFQYALIFMAMVTLPLSEYSLKQKLKKVLQIQDRKQRIESFVSSLVIKLSIIEFVNILSIIVYFLSGHKSFLYISLILIVFFLFSRPVKEKIINDLNL